MLETQPFVGQESDVVDRFPSGLLRSGVGSDPITDTEDPGDGEATRFSRRVLHVCEQLAVGGMVLLAICAAVAARHPGSLPVQPIPVAGWGFGAAVCALALAALVNDPGTVDRLSLSRRRALGGLLLVLLLTCVAGVVTAAHGVAGPAWVLFVPVVVVCGVVLGPGQGLGVGALAGGGLYVAAGLSHTLDDAGVGRLIVLLPAMPFLGWAAGALAAASRDALAAARRQRAALESDVATLTALLEQVAQGDLSAVPALAAPADQATEALAVAFSDTLLSLRRLVRQLSGVADQLAGNSADLVATATDHVGAVEEQASAVAQTTHTIEELAATATAIADTALRVARYAGSTRADVDAGATAVVASTEAMTAIGERVHGLATRAASLDERVATIADATRQIDDLSRQTTMLAVNAAIEAARSGDSGHGFATVAAEVGGLAAKAREATAAIGRVVGDLQREVAATAEASHDGALAVAAGLSRQSEVEASLARISEMVDHTALAAREITEATRQQRMASDQVVAAMHQVTSASSHARSATRGHATAAARLRDLAASVRSSVARFRVSATEPMNRA